MIPVIVAGVFGVGTYLLANLVNRGFKPSAIEPTAPSPFPAPQPAPAPSIPQPVIEGPPPATFLPVDQEGFLARDNNLDEGGRRFDVVEQTFDRPVERRAAPTAARPAQDTFAQDTFSPGTGPAPAEQVETPSTADKFVDGFIDGLNPFS